MSKVEEFVKYLENTAARHDPYVWGGQGQKLLKLTVLDLIDMETSADNAARVIKYIYRKKSEGINMKSCRIFDCSGLMTYKLLKLGIIKSDMTAKQLYNACKIKGPIRELKEPVPGILLFQGETPVEIGHVGGLVSNNRSVEAKGRDFGVVNTEYDPGRWDYYGVIF